MNNQDINFELLEICKGKIGKEPEYKDQKIENISCVDESKLTEKEEEELTEIGAKIISKGKYAVVTMAGGQRN